MKDPTGLIRELQGAIDWLGIDQPILPRDEKVRFEFAERSRGDREEVEILRA